jgi:hypothetical protein
VPRATDIDPPELGVFISWLVLAPWGAEGVDPGGVCAGTGSGGLDAGVEGEDLAPVTKGDCTRGTKGDCDSVPALEGGVAGGVPTGRGGLPGVGGSGGRKLLSDSES